MAVTEGSFRLVGMDASGTRREVIYGGVRTESLDISTDIRQQLYVPASGATFEEDDVIAIELKGDTAGNFDSGSTIRIPVRIQNKKTGSVRETYLTGTEFGVTATNLDYTTEWTQTCKYTVSAQERVRLGHMNAVNSRIYVALVLTA